VSATRADDISTAKQQLQQVSARRAVAQQRLARATGEAVTVTAQLNSNAQQLAALHQQTAALQQQASTREASLNSDMTGLLSQLQQARSALAAKQQDFARQQAAAKDRLRTDQDDLRSAESQLRSTEAQRAQLDRDSTALAGQLQAMDADVARRSQEIAGVLVQLYKLSQTSALNLVLSAGNVSDGLNRLTLLGTVSQHDQDLLLQLSNERDLTRRQHEILSQDLAATEQLKQELDAERGEISVRAGEETSLMQELQAQLTAAETSFNAQAAGLDASIQTIQTRIAANRQQLSAARLPLLAQQAVVAAAQQAGQIRLTQVHHDEASAQAQIAAAEHDQAAAAQLIRQLQAQAAARAAAERAAEAAQQAAAQARARAAAAAGAAATMPSTSNAHFSWPLAGPITQGYGPTSYWFEPPGHGYAHFHTGIDIAAAYGSAVRAAAGGVIIHTGWFGGGNWGYGDCIIIVHDATFSTLYGHLSGVVVRANEVVHQGQVIGYEGSTGNSSGPHLHFEIRVDGNPVSPNGYL